LRQYPQSTFDAECALFGMRRLAQSAAQAHRCPIAGDLSGEATLE
jgi:hypothetical protein